MRFNDEQNCLSAYKKLFRFFFVIILKNIYEFCSSRQKSAINISLFQEFTNLQNYLSISNFNFLGGPP